MSENRKVLVSLFSKHYSLQGISMINSFSRHYPNAKINILALDRETYRILNQYYGQSISLTCIFDDNELNDEFYKILKTRSYSETIFTLKAIWIQKNAKMLPENDILLYADSDIYFFNYIPDLDLHDWEFLLSPHHFPKKRNSLLSGGYYNAGLIGVKNSDSTKRALNWWVSEVKKWEKDSNYNLNIWPYPRKSMKLNKS